MPKSDGLAPDWDELTPRALRCGVGACPGVYLTPEGRYVIIGRTLSPEEVAAALPNRVGSHETAIEIERGYIDDLSHAR
ncbi:MAG: hypothetical protein QOH47_388 [Sphingomonadales bacterium]|jgi:hypothetical protein|nr:hypothetical protein [Sphingomonadales bacterium]